ncbi:MAG: UDP-N-acetylmuramoyl-L-alanyl-D-glutamate--2,6-diaminopimelate ligase [Armatimonadetes bacterium]|nr:UDP-N-acetylmuramoyl-L-alanyl-D-glutamate--2,6-diaminopimelate ligase [Armatimonadota bacterium]MBS1712068.1 UDP-N-acetylmuramoyl-L-alanyl-D-glutamate--2,6-diaminopimelate ligase [Armatimonadota bacterium]MBX3109378.1 UDP-N-acetylmuramoyl-L-alanyl-D-glutamate--2,6-diaminopimelate ligase [Fimbriimonadaceae bacterium]
MVGIRLSELAGRLQLDAGLFSVASGDPVITGVCADSRSVRPGDLFVCMPSASRDTHSFLPDVAAKGAVAAVVHGPGSVPFLRDAELPDIFIEPTGSRFNFSTGQICREVLGDPSAEMEVVGITGTNGKTTTAWIMRQAYEALGERAAYLGTLGYHDGQNLTAGANTTPFPVDLWNTLADAREKGVGTFVMEVSSHSLQERRVAGIGFDAGVFLNLTQDHLDYHGSMADYAAAKKLLFTEWAASTSKRFTAVLNGEDPVARAWMRDLPCEVWTFGSDGSAIQVEISDLAVDKMELIFAFGEEPVPASIPLGGAFNIQNVTACAATMFALGESPAQIVEGLSTVKPAPGRFEPVPNGTGISVLVDYAHTPDALSQLLGTVRSLAKGRIITVFGCGGDRDRSKRPLMAAESSRHSDYSVVTSDNPRTEDPQAILDDIAVGMTGDFLIIPDRREAIFAAIAKAEPGDVVVIAGKGHEDYQIIGRTKHWFDDRVVAAEALSCR